MEPFYFVFNNLLTLLIASTVAWRLFRDRSSELVFLGTAVLFPVLILLAIELLGVFNLLFNLYLTLLLLLLSVPILFGTVLHHRQFLPSPSGRRLVFLFLLVLLAAAGGFVSGRYIFVGTTFCFDDLSYHATAAGHWLQDHSIRSGPFNYHYHNPMNAELLSLWWMLPFGQDGFAFLTGLYWLLLTCVSAWILADRIGAPFWARFLILLPFFFSKHIYHQVTYTFSGVDLAGPAMILAALCFLFFRDENTKTDRRLLFFSGLACGYAVGCKVPFAAVALLLSVWLFAENVRHTSLVSRFESSGLFISGTLLTGFFWYGRNIVLTGNPVFPGQLGPWRGPLTSEIQFPTKIIGLLVNSRFDPALTLELFLRHLDWPLSMGILSLTGCAGAILYLIVGRKDSPAITRRVVLLLTGAGVMLLTYINMPFSGTYNSPDAPMQLSLRFAIAPFLIGIVLFSLLLKWPGKKKLIFILLFALLTALALIEIGFLLSYAVAGVLLLMAAASVHRAPISIRSHQSLPFILLGCAGFLTGLSVAFPYQQVRTNRNLFSITYNYKPAGRLWQQLETFPPGTVSALSGPESYRCYPLLGRRQQHTYQVLDKSGNIEERLYKRYLKNPDAVKWWSPDPKAISNPEVFLHNAAQAGIEYLFLIRYDDGTWPITPHDLTHNGWDTVWQEDDLMISRRR